MTRVARQGFPAHVCNYAPIIEISPPHKKPPLETHKASVFLFFGRRNEKTCDFCNGMAASKDFAENRRKPQIGLCHLRSVTFSSALEKTCDFCNGMAASPLAAAVVTAILRCDFCAAKLLPPWSTCCA